VLTAGARTRKALGGSGLEPVPVVAGGQGQFSGSARLERRFFTDDENLKKCMMGGGGEFRSCMWSVTSAAGEACK
jgi:hypothetical protein